ncbi:sensor histidine kinase [Pelagicoccus mobilis]|uniref:histidine kinase n=1 Tax=Pelagicoccus mobilis TaxID=415221 RepID=A0A934RWX5_9BACT|nr:HAMP domain-containing sensor histidine kinase [Pelagicoccus mobilis]MBK1879250.1 HAMP domain-containing histidine kinase [Pelagicoccus mobilis]
MPAPDPIRAIPAAAKDAANLSSPGPGITYLLDFPSKRLLSFSKLEGRFPNAFYKLLEANERWEDLVLENFRSAYCEANSEQNFQEEIRYRIQINRRSESLPVVDYREIIRDADGNATAIAGRLVDDSFHSVAFDALARRSWKEIAGSMTRRYLHDFNNTIAGIYSLSELYAEPGSDPKSTAEAMGHIRDCSIRAQDLTKKIRHLTSLEPGHESLFDLGSLAEEQREYMTALLPKGASINLEIQPGQHPIRIDPNLFRQAILHLTGNSSDACGDDAEISIRITQHEQNGQQLACLEFADNGTGFKPEELSQATAPFYTTKDSDNHPGLGLSIVSNFAAELGGHIELANTDKGALVRFCLPLLETAPSKPAEAPPPPKPRTPGKPTTAKPAPASAPKTSETIKLLVYSWEDISRHPLLLAMKKAGWETTVHLEPGPLLLDLLDASDDLNGVLVFKSALDEKAEPLISELGQARGCDKVALVTLGESPDALSVSAKRICGFTAPGTSKPTALLNKLHAFFR